VSGARLGETEYAELVARVRAAVAGTIPPGASVLVVSKGDAALLRMPGCSAGHFPQDGAGEYAGHHPHDSAAAIGELERLRRLGAEYLVLPATARWWLDFYEGFAAHLASHGEVLADVPDACLVYGLGARAGNGADVAMSERPVASVDQVREFLENLISTDSRVVVLDAAEGTAAALAPLVAVQLFPEEVEAHDDEGLLGALGQLAERGAEYLVVPRGADEWLDGPTGPGAELEESCRRVADQRHLCRVFELAGMREAG
jgi:hypothetical protein